MDVPYMQNSVSVSQHSLKQTDIYMCVRVQRASNLLWVA